VEVVAVAGVGEVRPGVEADLLGAGPGRVGVTAATAGRRHRQPGGQQEREGARSGPGRGGAVHADGMRVQAGSSATPADSVHATTPQRLLDLLGSAPGRRSRPGAPDQGLGRRPGTVRRRPRTARYRRANHSCHGASARRRVTWWFGADPDQSAPIPRAQRPRRPVVSWAVHPIDGGFRFAPPTARRRLVPRPRLLALLRARFSRRVVAVVAPAGFGKTTLLAQAVAEADATRDRIDLWLSCTSDDEAASSLTDGLCRAAGVDPQPSPEAAVDAVAAALWHRAPAQVAIVLDDVHLVAPGSSGAAALARLVAALPRNGHVVLAGRTPPPVPLARLDVQGEVVRVGEADLSFSPDELADFARQRGVPLDQVAACGGWPALAELSASGAPGTDAEYLWEEVLGRLTEDQRRDLALVAHAEITDPDVAAAVLGHDVDLDALTRELPLAKVGGEGGRLVHPLWLPHLAA